MKARARPTIKDSHSMINARMTSVHYQGNLSGICFGVAAMGLHAMLARDVKTFDDRIVAIYEAGDALKVKIHTSQEKWKKIVSASKYIMTDKILNGGDDQHQLDTLLETQWQNLSATDRHMLTTHAFFNGIELYFAPAKFTHLFEAKRKPNKQDLIKTSFLTSSKIIDAQGGMSMLADHTGSYSKKELIQYFSSLTNALVDASLENPVGILLSNFDHAISIGYDRREHGWTFIDAEELPSNVYSDKEIVEKIFRALGSGKRVPMCTKIFTTTLYANKSSNAIQSWQTKEPVKTLHTITPKRVKACEAEPYTWLDIALHNEHIETVKALIDAGANPNRALPESEMTPLHISTIHQNTEMLRLLLDKKANPNQPMALGKTPLHLATGFKSTHIVSCLLNQGADPTLKADIKTSVMMAHAKEVDHEIPLTHLIREKNNGTLTTYISGMTPLHIAAFVDDIETVINILDRKPNSINLQASGMTAKQLAAAMGSMKVVSLLDSIHHYSRAAKTGLFTEKTIRQDEQLDRNNHQHLHNATNK